MLKWIFEKLFGWPWCAHKWATQDRIRVFDGARSTRPTNTLFVLRCEKCGDIKQRSVGL